MREDTVRINECSRLEGVLSGLDPLARAMMERYLAGLSIAQIAAALERAEAETRDELRALLPQVQALLNR